LGLSNILAPSDFSDLFSDIHFPLLILFAPAKNINTITSPIAQNINIYFIAPPPLFYSGIGIPSFPPVFYIHNRNAGKCSNRRQSHNPPTGRNIRIVSAEDYPVVEEYTRPLF
jgi:hypothetical protein